MHARISLGAALVYFPLCAWLGRNDDDPATADAAAEGAVAAVDQAWTSENSDGLTARSGQRSGEQRSSVDQSVAAERVAQSTREQGIALALALCTATLARGAAGRFLPGYELPLSTAAAVAAASLLPRAIGRYARAGTELGTTAIYFFFASAGWSGGSLSSASMLRGGPVLLAFLTMLCACAAIAHAATAARRSPTMRAPPHTPTPHTPTPHAARAATRATTGTSTRAAAQMPFR